VLDPETVQVLFVGRSQIAQNKIEKPKLASRFVTQRHPSLQKIYRLALARFDALLRNIEHNDAAGPKPEAVPRTKEGRPALKRYSTDDSTSWMPADHADRSSLTFACVPANIQSNKKGEQQWRL
jgi:hypothetical protein